MFPRISRLQFDIVNGNKFIQLLSEIEMSDDDLIKAANSNQRIPVIDRGDIDNARCGRGMLAHKISTICSILEVKYEDLVLNAPFDTPPVPDDLHQRGVYGSHREGRFGETLGRALFKMRELRDSPIQSSEDLDRGFNACCNVTLGARPVDDYIVASEIFWNYLYSLLEIACERNFSVNKNSLRRVCIEVASTLRDSGHFKCAEDLLNFAEEELGIPTYSDSVNNRRLYARSCEHQFMLYSGTGVVGKASICFRKLVDFTGDDGYGTTAVWLPRMWDHECMQKSDGKRNANPHTSETRELIERMLKNAPNEWSKFEAKINSLRVDQIEDKPPSQDEIRQVARQHLEVGPHRQKLSPTLCGLPKVMTDFLELSLDPLERSLLRRPEHFVEASFMVPRMLKLMKKILSEGKSRDRVFNMENPRVFIQFNEGEVLIDDEPLDNIHNMEIETLQYALWKNAAIKAAEAFIIFPTWHREDAKPISNPQIEFRKRTRNIKSKIQKDYKVKIHNFKKNKPERLFRFLNVDSNIIEARALYLQADERYMDKDYPNAFCLAKKAFRKYERYLECQLLLLWCYENMNISELSESNRALFIKVSNQLFRWKSILEAARRKISTEPKDDVVFEDYKRLMDSKPFRRVSEVYDEVEGLLCKGSTGSPEEREIEGFKRLLRELRYACNDDEKRDLVKSVETHPSFNSIGDVAEVELNILFRGLALSNRDDAYVDKLVKVFDEFLNNRHSTYDEVAESLREIHRDKQELSKHLNAVEDERKIEQDSSNYN